MRYAANWGLAAILSAALSAVAVAQCGSVDRSSPEAVKNEVNRLFSKTLDAMEGTLPSGVKVSTWMGWEPSTQGQIECLGAAAVPATSELLRSTNRSFGRILAVHMLGWEGGPEIVPPLAEILAAKPGDPLKVDLVKLGALEALTAAPADKALPVVEQVLRSEKNPQLLKEAALASRRDLRPRRRANAGRPSIRAKAQCARAPIRSLHQQSHGSRDHGQSVTYAVLKSIHGTLI